jgi:hypothetical protein
MTLLREKNEHKDLLHHSTDGFKGVVHRSMASSSVSGMQELSPFKGSPLIAFVFVPQGENHTHPHIRQGANGHAMAFALRRFALIGVVGPGFLPRREPGKVVQGVAQWLDTGKALVNGSVLPALPGHRAGPSQGLDAPGVSIAAAVVPPFCQQPRASRLPAAGRLSKMWLSAWVKKRSPISLS